MENIIVAIDGFAACGKSTTAKLVAKQLGYAYIDTGAMYRAVTLYFIKNDVDYGATTAVEEALPHIDINFVFEPKSQSNLTFLNGENVEEEIRTMEVTSQVSEVAAISEVRSFLVAQQQQMGLNKGIVMDGRDIGTVVFPNAELKVFMTADMEARALRRQQELINRGREGNFDEIIENLKKRDFIDSNREDSPLRQAADAHVIDTSNITIDQQVEQILNLVHNAVTA